MTLRIAAQHADIWHGFGDAETLQRKNGILDDHCRRLGRDPGEIERSAGVNPKRVAGGDELLAAGITQLTLGMDARSFDPDAIRAWVAWRDERNAAGADRPTARGRPADRSIPGVAVRRYRDGGRMTDASLREEPIG